MCNSNSHVEGTKAVLKEKNGTPTKKINKLGANPNSFTSKLVFAVIMMFSIASVFSSLLQLEKVFYYDVEPKPISSTIQIPILSTLVVQESFLLCTITLIFLSFYVYHQLQLLKKIQLNMPEVKVSTQLPFLGTALEFLSNTPWDLMESWHRTYGPIYTFKLLGRTMVSIEHPDHLKDILQSKIQNVKKDVEFAYKPFLPILGKGIVTSEGKSWMDQRRKISGALKVDILEGIPKATLHAVQRLMVKLDQCCDEEGNSNGKTLDIAEELRHLTLQVISETFMSLEAEESDTTFATMYLPIVEEGNKRVWRPERTYMFFTPCFWKYIFGVRRLNRYVSNLIEKRWDVRRDERKQNDPISTVRTNDILDKVLDHFEKEHPGKDLSSSDVRQLRDEFKTFMLAGHETSAAMMTWAFYELMNDNSLMKKVEAEAISVFGSGGDWLKFNHESLPSREELANLRLSEACLRESLRKYSVVPSVIRQIVKPTQVGNHLIPKGSCVVINIQSTHHNEQYWPNPMSYDPNRFIDPKIRPEPFTFIPFIDGPRNCLGQYLALLESKMVVSLISMRYSLQMKNTPKDGEDQRHRFMVPLIPKDPMDVIVTKRSKTE